MDFQVGVDEDVSLLVLRLGELGLHLSRLVEFSQVRAGDDIDAVHILQEVAERFRREKWLEHGKRV